MVAGKNEETRWQAGKGKEGREGRRDGEKTYTYSEVLITVQPKSDGLYLPACQLAFSRVDRTGQDRTEV